MEQAERDRMPAWVPKAIMLAILGYVGLRTLSFLFGQLRGLLMVLVVSLFLAFAIEPAVNWMEEKGIRRGIGTGIVFVAILAVVGVFVFAIGALVVSQAQGFIKEAPGYVEDIERLLNDRFDVQVDTAEAVEELTAAEGPLRDLATRLAGDALSFSAQVLGLVFQLFTVTLFTFYLVADGPRLRRLICSVLPPERQRDVLDTWDLAVSKTGGYLYSRALLAGLATTTTYFALFFLDVPFALALALWVGAVSQFVPVVGTYLAGILAVGVAALNEPVDGIWVLVFILAYQQLENYVWAPRITARTMNLHPAVAFGSVIAGAGILGGVGAVLALPAAAIVQAFFSTYLERHPVTDVRLAGPRRKSVPLAPAGDGGPGALAGGLDDNAEQAAAAEPAAVDGPTDGAGVDEVDEPD